MFRRTRIGLILLAGVVVGGLAWRVSLSQEASDGLFAADDDALAGEVTVQRSSSLRQATSQDLEEDDVPSLSNGPRIVPAQPKRSDLSEAELSDDEPFRPAETLGRPVVDDFDDPSVEMPRQPPEPPTPADLRQRLIHLTTKRSVRMSNEELDAAIKELSEQLDAQDQQAEAELQQVIERLQEIVKSFPGTPAAARAENALNATKVRAAEEAVDVIRPMRKS